MEDSVPGKVDEKATQLHAIASLKVLLDATKPQRGAATSSAANHVKINLKETTLGRPNGNIDATLDLVGFKFTLNFDCNISLPLLLYRQPMKTCRKLSVWRGHQEQRTVSPTYWWRQSSFHFG